MKVVIIALSNALKGQKLIAQGNTLGFFVVLALRPVRAKAFKYQSIHKAFALTGRLADCYYTQGVALGYELLGLQPVLRPQAYLAVL